MRLNHACLAICLSGALGVSGPALAGDLSNGGAGGIRDYGSAGVPVPMPTAYEESFKWYVRGDLGTAFKNTGSVATSGFPLEVSQPAAWHNLSIVSMGFGKYLTPSLRAEFTVDYRTDRHIESSIQYANLSKTAFIGTTTLTVNSPGGTQTSQANRFVTNNYLGTIDEDTSYQNSTFLMSAFYDMNRGGQLRPYIGAGIGLARHQLKQSGNAIYDCKDSYVTTTPDLPIAPPQVSASQPCDTSTTSGLKQTYQGSSSNTSVGWGLAAQASVGLTYDITPRTHLDTGYRLMWQSGHVSVAGAGGLSTITLKDQINHEIRTGVRWDLW